MPAATNLVTREDTLLGVCQGLGEEFGFQANYLRVLLGALLLWNAEAVVGGYMLVGIVLAVSRWLWPVRRPVMAADAAVPAADNDGAAPTVALAA